MPWRGPDEPGEFPTLGYLVADYIEAKCAIPDGDHMAEPFLLTDEMLAFLLQHYRLKPDATEARPASAWEYRGSQLVRPQKWGKGPFASAIIVAEADGPVVFAGWDANGEPVGRPWPTPWIQVTAVTGDQTDNVWRALVPMIELGDIGADMPDTGETRINLPSGGRIEPVTSSARSRLGQRVTFVPQDETHSWVKTNGGRTLADNQRRNLAGTGGRWMETTNGWDPAEMSVAQQTAESPATDIYRDHRLPDANLSIRNKKERPILLKQAYGDSWWVDLERVEAEVVDLIDRDQAQAERFFANRIMVAVDAWIDPEGWDACAGSRVVQDREPITLGFDGSMFDDSTALVACRVSDGYLWLVDCWEKPDGPAGDGWEVPRAAVEAAVTECFTRWRPVRMYCDPPYWQDDIARWVEKWGDSVVKEWWTNRERAMVAALERLQTAVLTSAVSGDVLHDESPVLRQHVVNARRKKVASGLVIRKDRPGSARKIDAAMAAALAYEARGDAQALGLGKKRSAGVWAF